MKKVAVFGAGGCGREVLQFIKDINELSPEWDFQGFLVESQYCDGQEVHGYPKYPYLDWIKSNPDAYVVIAIGSSRLRERIVNRIEAQHSIQFASIVHPTAWVTSTAKIGSGTIIGPFCAVSADVQVGRHCYINASTVLGHDCVLSDFVTTNPGSHVSGSVLINTGGELGACTIVLPHLELGSFCVLGAGSVVTKNIEANSVYVGNPARLLRRITNVISEI